MSDTTISDTTIGAEPAPGERLRMDPRIRERRVAVRRDEGRRRLRILLITGSVVAAFGVAYGATRSPLFDVDRVVVQGARHTTPAEIEQAAGLRARVALADIDPVSSARTIEGLPWVKDAVVSRQWPGTVKVRLVERAPVAALPAAAGGWALVDGTGRVVTNVEAPPPGMVTVAGPAAPGVGDQLPDVTRAPLAVLDHLPPSLGERVNGLTVADDGSVDVHATGLPVVRFGPPTQVREKVVALETLVAKADLRRVEAIDVRVPTAPVLTRP